MLLKLYHDIFYSKNTTRNSRVIAIPIFLLILLKLFTYLWTVLQCQSVSCCTARKVMESLFEKEDRQSVCLMLAQTFLLQDWMQPQSYCCTKVGFSLQIQVPCSLILKGFFWTLANKISFTFNVLIYK